MCSYEIEAKYAIQDIDRYRKQLKDLKASYIRTVKEKDIYFQHPCRNFHETDEALRVRIEDHRCLLTYKGAREKTFPKKRIELNVKVGEPQGIIEILKALGFRVIATLEKRREIYVVGNWEISLDYVHNLGYFIELEFKGKKFSRLSLREIVKKLGIEEEKYIHESYLELYLKTLKDYYS